VKFILATDGIEMQAPLHKWEAAAFAPQLLHKLPWYYHIALLDKLKTREERLWYAAKAVEHNWARNILVMQIESRLIERELAGDEFPERKDETRR
jgi:hypothetical protein